MVKRAVLTMALLWFGVVCCVQTSRAGSGSFFYRSIPFPQELEAKATVYKYPIELEGVHTVKTLLITFPYSHPVLSTRQGFRQTKVVANHSMPDSVWPLVSRHVNDYPLVAFGPLCRRSGFTMLDLVRLSTGADLDAMAVVTKKYQWITMTAAVTAGAKSNAMRMGVDCGEWLDGKRIPSRKGTINIILLTNVSLGQAEMARALITITEAKTAALEDLEIKSSYTPGVQATGTGTDHVVVVSGTGKPVQCMIGHCKASELVARAVKDAVETALIRQIKIWLNTSETKSIKELPQGVLHHPLFKADLPDISYKLLTGTD